jgi:hypothetical protein
MRSDARKKLAHDSRVAAEKMPPGPEKDRIIAAADRLDKFDGAARDAALASSVYENEGAPPGFTRLDAAKVLGHADTRGMEYALYQDDKTGEIALAFRGTEKSKFIRDFSENLGQAFGIGSEDYRQSMIVAAKASEFAAGLQPPRTIKIVGHSKGGGQAIAAATVAPGARTTVFNPAYVNPRTVERSTAKDMWAQVLGRKTDDSAGLMASRSELGKGVDSFVVKGEALDLAQRYGPVAAVAAGYGLAGPLGGAAVASGAARPDLVSPSSRTDLAADRSAGPIDRHGMASVQQGLLGQMESDVGFLGGDPSSMINPADYENH